MQISLSNNSFAWISTEEAIRRIARAGFDKMDLKMTRRDMIYRPDLFFKELDHCGEIARECGLGFGQAHGPYSAGLDKELDPEILHRAQLLALQGAERIGIPYLVVHPCVYTWCMGDKGRKEAAEKNLEWFLRFIPFLKNSTVKMCIENCYLDDLETGTVKATFGCDPEEMNLLVDELNMRAGKQVFGVCMDTGHCHCSGGDVVTMAKTLGKRILALHMHDNDGRDDYHMPPFTIKGGLPWKALMETLGEIGYEGTLNFEIDSLILRKTPEMSESGMKLLYDIGVHLRTLCKVREEG